MPRKTLYDPTFEPYSALVKLYVTPSQRHDLDQLVTELRVSRSSLVRQAVMAGLPQVIDTLRERRRRGLRPGAVAPTSGGPAVRRGARRDGDVADAWRRHRPEDPPEPPRDYPQADED